MNYFRGFKEHDRSINLQGDLIVLDGRNSSGKTSFAEAIEWLLTGHICRRDMGDPKELAESISNRFRPDNEETWVEAVLEQEGKIYAVRRILVKDYDTKRDSSCETKIVIDGKAINTKNNAYLLDELFSGVLPLLMQHTLRLFVFDSPDKRRAYFEQLLSLDRITLLIEKSVVGDARLDDFPNKSGSTMLGEWDSLKNAAFDKKLFSRVEKADQHQMRDLLQDMLIKIATQQFEVETDLSFDKVVEKIQSAQKLVRQQNFPLLEQLRPKRTLDEALLTQLSRNQYNSLLEGIIKAQSDYKTAQISALTISESQMAISRSLQNLREVGLIIDPSNDQICPLCDYKEVPTLKTHRINEITNWDPIRQAVNVSKKNYQGIIEEMTRTLKAIQDIRYDLIPRSVPDQDWPTTDELSNNSITNDLRSELKAADQDLQEFDIATTYLISSAEFTSNEADIPLRLQKIMDLLPLVIEHARIYAARFAEFEQHIGVIASQDNMYTTRELWLSVVEKLELLLSDLKWESAKKKAQSELSSIRELLISARQKYLEMRRLDFNAGILDMWKKLRADTYSNFDKLFIPEPRGKGFPVKIEVKAVLTSNSETREVDALSVFSESQINAVGIAAFITRSKLMGHKLLVFDDPVQSMDEEHFKTFAKDILSHLCDEGFQVIVLTHSDTFAREISYAHTDRPTYVTLEIKHSKRNGCQINEGNRRIDERLDRAESSADDGDLQQAWIYVRLAVERLFTLVRIKYGQPDFQPNTWANHTAENMWKESIEDIFHRLAPDLSKRMPEIVKMTAGGAHDKPAESHTNLINAIKDVRPLISRLRIGG